MNDDALVPAWFAAKHLHVSPQLINYWRTAGRLVVAARDKNNRPLYRWGDLRKVEQQTRRTVNSSRNPARRPAEGPGSWAALNRQTSVA